MTVGLDIAKQKFQAHGVDCKGKVVLRKRLRRTEVASFFAGVEPCLVGLEASLGAHYWFRVLSGLGHTVRLIAPQFVKPFVKSQKNDANDAEAICEAVSRPSMRFVPAKKIEQQDLQCLHGVRSRLIGCRTQLVNQIRGLLAEYGIVIPPHAAQLRRHRPAVLEEDTNDLTMSTRCLFHSLYEELLEPETKMSSADQRIERAFQENAECQRIGAVEGIGPVTATAVVAAISDGHAFRNGRQFAAWLGLVPRQHSNGGKTTLLVSASAAIPICARCWCMEPGRWFIEPRPRSTVAAAGSTTNNRDRERQELASQSPIRTHAFCGP